MKKAFKIKIHPLLLPLILFYFIQGNIALFLGMLFFVTLHEIGHCVTAYCFGAKIKQIWFTPIGERAVIKGLEKLSFLKRQIVFFSGPFISSIMAIVCLFCHNAILAVFNIMLAVFNFMPFLPLDGGNAMLHIAGRKYGILKTASVMVKVSKGFGYFLMIIGTLQVILYPFNISILLIGCYIVYSNQREYLQITYQPKLGEMVSAMHFDKYFFYCCMINGKIEWKSQKEIMELLLKKGVEGYVWQ